MKYFFLILTVTLLSMPNSISAIRVQIPKPLFESKGSASNRSVSVYNDADTMKPLQVSITKRSHDLDGNENFEKTADFDIFPGQFIIQPDQEQVITLRYIGAHPIDREIAYRVIVEELPVNLARPKEVSGRAESQLSITLKFIKSIYVLPKGSIKPEVSIHSIAPFETEKKEKKLLLILENKGKQHFLLTQALLTVSSALKENISHTPVEIKLETKDIREGNLLSNDQRRLFLDWPASLPFGPVTATLKVQNK